jgi:hypothetical protein
MKWPMMLLSLFLIATDVQAQPTEVLIDDFENGLAPGWSVQSFVGFNDYRLAMDGSNHVMLAESRATASSLYFKTNIDLKEYPVLSWRWKIESTVSGGDVRFKKSDDYPARIYVVFPHWYYPKTRSINYIWANQLPRGEVAPSPYTENSQMVAIESGNGKAGEWLLEKRNVYEDYRRIFAEEPGRVGTIAIMTDSDDTGTSARAWYDDIRFLAD